MYRHDALHDASWFCSLSSAKSCKSGTMRNYEKLWETVRNGEKRFLEQRVSFLHRSHPFTFSWHSWTKICSWMVCTRCSGAHGAQHTLTISMLDISQASAWHQPDISLTSYRASASVHIRVRNSHSLVWLSNAWNQTKLTPWSGRETQTITSMLFVNDCKCNETFHQI